MSQPESLTKSDPWNGGIRAQPDAPYEDGYDVITTDIQASERGFNAWLVDASDNTHVKLWVSEITTNLSLAGSTAQSRLTRDFYAKNFQQPSFTIKCQAIGQRDHGLVAEFIHKAQRNCVIHGTLMGFTLPADQYDRPNNAKHRGHHGHRKGLSIAGYVANAPRTHRRHDPAPDFTFDFVVARMRSGPFEENSAQVAKLAKWTDIFDAIIKGTLIPQPLTVDQQAQQQSNLDAANFAIDTLHSLADLFDGG